MDDLVELLVGQPNRPDVARRLLNAAAQAGLDPVVVRSTSDGFTVPELVYELAYTGDSRDAGAAAKTEPAAEPDAEAAQDVDTPRDDQAKPGDRRKRSKGA